METVHQMVDKEVAELREMDSLDPSVVAAKMVKLSALWASVNKELLETRIAYAGYLKQMLFDFGVVGKAKIYAEASPEYKNYLTAESYSKSIQEIVRSGKKYLNLINSEKWESHS